jgi:parallel beta-helix repeat protein
MKAVFFKERNNREVVMSRAFNGYAMGVLALKVLLVIILAGCSAGQVGHQDDGGNDSGVDSGVDGEVDVDDGDDYGVNDGDIGPLPGYHLDNNHPQADDSGPGSLEEPWKTLSTALSKLDYGDVLYIHTGNDYSPVEVIGYGGNSESDQIIIRNYPGERPVFSNGTWLFSSSKYVTLSGFEFDHACIHADEGSHHLIIENNLVHHCRFGIRLYDSDDNIISHNEVYGSELGEQPRMGEVGITLSSGSDRNLVEYNICYYMFADYEQGDGIGIFTDSSYNVISHNICHDNPDDNLDGWNSGGYNVIEYNIMYRAGYDENGQPSPTSSGNGKGIKTNGMKDGAAYKWIIRYNVAFENTTAGISNEDATSGNENIFYNNTTFDNDIYGGFVSLNGGIFVNNLSVNDACALETGNGNIVESLTTGSAWFEDPQAGVFHLAAGAYPIDRGQTQIDSSWTSIEITDFIGSQPDVGAFEYGAFWPADEPPGLFDMPTRRMTPTAAQLEEQYQRIKKELGN